jgi:hypothetical protein
MAARAPPPRDLRRSEFRVIVSGLPPSVSWQDLKDFCRTVERKRVRARSELAITTTDPLLRVGALLR